MSKIKFISNSIELGLKRARERYVNKPDLQYGINVGYQAAVSTLHEILEDEKEVGLDELKEAARIVKRQIPLSPPGD